jgi:hypothetical protein
VRAKIKLAKLLSQFEGEAADFSILNKLLSQFEGEAADSSNLNFKWKVDECNWNPRLRCAIFGNYRDSELKIR